MEILAHFFFFWGGGAKIRYSNTPYVVLKFNAYSKTGSFKSSGATAANERENHRHEASKRGESRSM